MRRRRDFSPVHSDLSIVQVVALALSDGRYKPALVWKNQVGKAGKGSRNGQPCRVKIHERINRLPASRKDLRRVTKAESRVAAENREGAPATVSNPCIVSASFATP